MGTLQNIPGRMIAFLPLPLMQPLLHKIVTHVAKRRPELFERLGNHMSKSFVIDPTNMPFAFLLCPNPKNPQLRAYRRTSLPRHDACIAGTFLTLLDMTDGSLDGDALFFSRALSIEGDTEAVVALRNALDDLDGSIIDDIATMLGKPAHLLLSVLRKIRRQSK